MDLTTEGDGITQTTDDEISQAFESAMHASSSVEAAVLLMLDKYDFAMHTLERIIGSQGLSLQFSRATFKSIAPVVGLHPDGMLRDAMSFDIRRARIPSDLFEKIVDDVQVAIHNYGLPGDQTCLQTSSMLVSAFFTRLVAQFQLFLSNSAESSAEASLMGVDRVKRIFQAFGTSGLIFVQVRPHLLDGKEYYDLVARVIADLLWCHYKSGCGGMGNDVHCILSDGTTFQFFRLSVRDKTSFQCAIFPFLNSPATSRQSLKLVDIRADSLVNFWQGVRVLCESIYYILLVVYRDCADSYNSRQYTRGQVEDKAERNRLIGWRIYAARAKNRACAAGEKRFEGDVNEAEKLADEALVSLQKSFDNAPAAFKRSDVQLVSELVTDTIIFM